MKLIGLISWYDEPVELLERAIGDIIACGVTHLVALDGAYATFPGGKACSPPEQAVAIRKACAAAGVELLLGAPSDTWTDGEPQKRSALFDLGYTFSPTADDWFFVQDADQTVDSPRDIRPWLTSLQGDVVDTLLYEHDDTRFDDATRRRFVRNLFRCNPGLHVDPSNHWTYKDGQGRVLWGMNSVKACAMAPIVMHNWSRDRTADRAAARDDYYLHRNTSRLEHWEPETCFYCESAWAFTLATGFKLQALPDGTRELISDRTLYVCEEHGDREVRKNAARARYLADGNAQVERTIAEVMAGTIARRPPVAA